MKTFGKKYSQFYDLVYQDKDYEGDIAFLEEFFKKYNTKKILDIGCGTGRHSILLAKKGYYVLGIDKSPEMIQMASEKHVYPNLVFKQGDILDFESDETFDACICLFDTLGYLKKKDIPKFFEITSKRLKRGGLLIVDYWDTKGVETFGLSSFLFKIFRTKERRLLRFSSSKFITPKVRIVWRFLLLPDFELFKEIHEKETFYFGFLDTLAFLNDLTLLKVVELSDINSMLIFQKS